ncbi:MAG: hypothetical protein WDN49_18560 [Acetobacteraceae bacterium]
MEAAREYNFKRYHYQGIGRYEPPLAYARGIADLSVLAKSASRKRVPVRPAAEQH